MEGDYEVMKRRKEKGYQNIQEAMEGDYENIDRKKELDYLDMGGTKTLKFFQENTLEEIQQEEETYLAPTRKNPLN